ncbi:dynein axonemal heavy chain, partial [Mytilus galloprovincialis]
LVDYRVEFTKWWVTEFKAVKFPIAGTVFDYFIDQETKKFEPWTKRIPTFEMDPDMPLQAALVHTAETTRVKYFLDMLVEKKRPVMLVGNAGTGKTKPLEKKAGRNFGPPGTRRLIYFVDDMNMPEVDKYFTVQPHTLIRQHIDHGHWYDRQKLSMKEIHNTQYVACMNPTAGSFTIDSRLQRHFCVFSVNFPNSDALTTIYTSILSQHLSLNHFAAGVQKYAPTLISGAVTLHNRITSTFLPTAVKFHYIFNLRDLSNIFQVSKLEQILTNLGTTSKSQ